MFGSTPGLYLLGASSTLFPVVTTKNVSRLCPKVESHQTRQAREWSLLHVHTVAAHPPTTQVPLCSCLFAQEASENFFSCFQSNLVFLDFSGSGGDHNDIAPGKPVALVTSLLGPCFEKTFLLSE